MAIICTSTAGNDVERFNGLEDLEDDLNRTARLSYASSVLARLRNGETVVKIVNGPAEDTYTVC
jgi:hypothetical protein